MRLPLLPISALLFLSVATTFARPFTEPELMERDLSWVQSGDTFRVATHLNLHTKPLLCFRHGNPIPEQERFSDSCCIRVNPPPSPLRIHPGAETAEVGSRKHQGEVFGFASNVVMERPSFGIRRVPKTVQLTYTIQHRIPIEGSGYIDGIFCYSKPVGSLAVPVSDEPYDDTSFMAQLPRKVSIGFMLKHLDGVLEYIPEPTRARKVITEGVQRHEPPPSADFGKAHGPDLDGLTIPTQAFAEPDFAIRGGP